MSWDKYKYAEQLILDYFGEVDGDYQQEQIAYYLQDNDDGSNSKEQIIEKEITNLAEELKEEIMNIVEEWINWNNVAKERVTWQA